MAGTGKKAGSIQVECVPVAYFCRNYTLGGILRYLSFVASDEITNHADSVFGVFSQLYFYIVFLGVLYVFGGVVSRRLG